jgi:fructoselysine-6-P-deglycase FrlB-like protein
MAQSLAKSHLLSSVIACYMRVCAIFSPEVLMIEREIASQPSAWGEAARRAAGAAGGLPERGMRLAILGCGTSYFVAQAMGGVRETSGHGETDAFPASEALVWRAYDGVLAVSRSGTTTEILSALERVPTGVVIMAVCAVPDSPVAQMVTHPVLLEFADERAVVQTRFPTTALALFRAHLHEDVDPLIAAADEALAASLPAGLADFERFVFLASGWSVGLANEAALKLREAAGAWTESYPAMEYRHGPVSATTSTTLVWTLGQVDESVLEEAADAGATVVDNRRDAMAELVLVQRAAVVLAKARGLNPDKPPHLSRSVVLQTTPEAVSKS